MCLICAAATFKAYDKKLPREERDITDSLLMNGLDGCAHTHTRTATGICSRDMQNLTTGSCVSLTTPNMGRRKGKMLG